MEFGAAAAVALHGCQNAGLFGTWCTVIADSDFGNLQLAHGLWQNGLHGIMMIKMGHGGFPKQHLADHLEGKEHGSHVVSTLSDGDEKYTAVGWHGKSDHLHGKKRGEHYISTFLATDCSMTTPGTPAEKKRHDQRGNRVASTFVNHPKLVEDYYGNKEGGTGMSTVDQNNKLWQYCLRIEDTMQTEDPWKWMICSVIGMWETNA